MSEDQTIEIPLEPGTRVTILNDVDLEERGSSGVIEYEGTVERYVPETCLLEMSDGTGLAEVREMVEEADGVQVMKE